MSSQDTSSYEQERRGKLQKLRDLGVNPFGQRTDNLRPLLDVKQSYTPDMGHDAGPVVKVAGRIMLKRDMGKLSFITLRDDTGDLQIGIDRKKVDDLSWNVRNLLDLADQIVIEGNLGVTNKGEVTIWATRVEMASKALLSPPAKYEGLQDVEQRYRQRYVDLWANPDVMQLAKKRMAIIDAIRAYLKGRGFAEVETPMLQPIHGGAAARPFKTKHEALDLNVFLRIAPELYLKRLLVGGMPKVFEINRNFRNEGISPRHNPEFTMLEAYEAYGSCETMAELVEDMICTVAMEVFGTLKIVHRRDAEGAENSQENTEEKVIDLSQRPWPRKSMQQLVEEAGWTFDRGSGVSPVNHGQDAHTTKQIHLADKTPAEQLTEVYEKLVEPNLINPTFVTRVPSVIIPLARKCEDDDFFADVFELAINGQEISPGYSELNDPILQAENFRNQVGDKAEQQQVDEDFLNALKFGMPPAGGMGMGIDRLVMMLTGAESIRDVILFPLMRPVE